MFDRVLNMPLYTNKGKKNLSLLKTLKTPNFNRQNETKTEKDHKNQLLKKVFLWNHHFVLMENRVALAHTTKKWFAFGLYSSSMESNNMVSKTYSHR